MSDAADSLNIALVDYKKGNIKSVERALVACGANVEVTSDPDAVRAANAVVLPGVGAFTDAMGTLEELGLADAMRDAVAEGKPFLGICLGQHLMFDGGTEHAVVDEPTRGLGIIPGIVEAMPKVVDGETYKVPHVGWNSVKFDGACANGSEQEGIPGGPLFAGIDQGEHFYFTHSYIAPASDFTIAETTHSVTFPSAVQKGLAFGVQFHPEKSSSAGAKMLENFVDIVRRCD